MPGLQKHSLKQERVSITKKKKHQVDSNAKVKQRIRIIYSDPDATDCSSDEESCSYVNFCSNGVKRVITEVSIFRNDDSGANPACKGGSKLKRDGKAGTVPRLGRSSSGFPGVRLRPSGKWVAEIRNPLQNGKRVWLGTFDTKEEAIQAHQKKKLEYETLLLEQQRNPSTNPNVHVSAPQPSTSEDTNANALCYQPSPSSVLDVSNANPFGAHPSVVTKTEDNENAVSNVVEAAPSTAAPPLEVKDLVEQTPFREAALGVSDMSSVHQELTMNFANSCNFGNDFEHFFDDLRMEDLPLCDLTDVDSIDIPNFDINLTSAELAWIDGALNTAGL